MIGPSALSPHTSSAQRMWNSSSTMPWYVCCSSRVCVCARARAENSMILLLGVCECVTVCVYVWVRVSIICNIIIIFFIWSDAESLFRS